jgi:hypothetical protein
MSTDHCVIDLAAEPPVFRCELCGAEQELEPPISLHEAAALGEQFTEEHAACAEPPEDHPSLTAAERNPTLR